MCRLSDLIMRNSAGRLIRSGAPVQDVFGLREQYSVNIILGASKVKASIILLLISVYALGHSHIIAQKMIAVTIDDLPLQRIQRFSPEKSSQITDNLLSKIISEKTPVTGFVNEDKLLSNGENDPGKISLLKKWLDAGCDLGNHTYSHKSANSVSLEEYKEDVLKGERVIRGLISEKGKTLKYFRHPFLQTGRSLETKNDIEKFLAGQEYTVAPVTLDNAEWIFAAAYDLAADSSDTKLMDYIGKEYLSYMKSKLEYWERQSEALFGRNISQILLIHANALNSDYYSKLMNIFRSAGYRFVSLDEALKDDAYKSEDTFTGAGGISWLHRWAVTQGKKRDFFLGEPEAPADIMNYARVDSE